jgi:hypothetical protein
MCYVLATVRVAIIQVSMRWKVGELRYGSDGTIDTWHYLKGRSDVIQKKGEPSLSLHLLYPYNRDSRFL